MAHISLSMNDLTTQVTSHAHPEGGTVLTLSDGVDVITIGLGERGMADVHRETGPDRQSLRGPVELLEVR